MRPWHPRYGLGLPAVTSHGLLPWERKNLRPSQTAGSNIPYLVALATFRANTPVELRPPAARIDDRAITGRRRITNRDRRRVVDLYQQGRSTRYVASEVGIGRATVLNILKQAGVERRPVGAHY